VTIGKIEAPYFGIYEAVVDGFGVDLRKPEIGNPAELVGGASDDYRSTCHVACLFDLHSVGKLVVCVRVLRDTGRAPRPPSICSMLTRRRWRAVMVARAYLTCTEFGASVLRPSAPGYGTPSG